MTEDDSKQLTKFGAEVYSLMSKRGVRSQASFAAMLRDDKGKEVPAHRLSPWFRGVNAPPQWLCRAISEALQLTQDEDIELALAFAYGSDIKVDSIPVI